MTTERNQAQQPVCQSCGDIFEYTGVKGLDICMSCTDRRAVERDAEQFRKAHQGAVWVNPNKFQTYAPERTRRLDGSRNAYVFEAGGHVRVVEEEDGEWIVFWE